MLRLTLTRSALCSALAFLAASTLAPSEAHATKKVYSPYVEAGELEIEWRGSYLNDDDSAIDGAQKQKYAVGYGINQFWATELYGEVEKSGDEDSDFEFTALEWENRFQLTERGEYFVDVGLYTAYEISREDGGHDKAEVKLLLGKDTGKFSHYANVILEQEVGPGAHEGTELGFALSTRYRYQPWLEPGVELHSDFGPLNESEPYDDQKHQVGPVIYGKLPYGFKYDTGYLFGVSDGAPDGEFKWILEYEVPLN